MTQGPLNAPTMAGAEALQHLLAGEVDEGLDLYREAFAGDSSPKLPIGLHLLFLQRSGQRAAAEALLKLALDCGANVALKAGGFGASPAESAAEYELLFARGEINAFMISEYLVALARLGRFDDLARWLDIERLIRVVRLDIPAPGQAVPLAEAVHAAIIEREDKAVYQDAVQSVRGMQMIKDFPRFPHPAVAALVDAVTEASRAYLESWAASDHPAAAFVPVEFKLEGWALISRGTGYNVPHVHNRGWATGVYYPAAVPGGGQLHVGRPKAGVGLDEQWGARSFTPEPGLFVLMPSFFTHWTVPLERPAIRTSVAFDLCAVKG